MAEYPSIYKAKVSTIDTASIEVFVPQIFGDMPVLVRDFVGDKPTALGMGWVMFQGGSPAHPVWIGT